MRYLQLVLAKVSFVTKQPDDMREVSWFDSSWKTYLWTKICLVGLLFKAWFSFHGEVTLIFSVTKMKMYWSAWSLPCSVGCLLVLLVSCGSLCGQHLGFAHFVHMWFNLWSTTVFSALLTLYSSGLLCGQPPSPVLSTSARGATSWTWFLQYIWADPCKLSDCSWVDFGKVVKRYLLTSHLAKYDLELFSALHGLSKQSVRPSLFPLVGKGCWARDWTILLSLKNAAGRDIW